MLEAGQIVLGRYVVDAPLGQGGMGAVFRGHHRRLGMPVALKVLSSTNSKKDRLRFQAEARLMARIRHPNVVTILDAGMVDGDLPCIAMELLDGHPLGDHQAVDQRPWRAAVDVGLAMLAGLAAIHDAEVLHRDLKPSNVVVCPGDPEVVKLIDFGIAEHRETEALGLTRTGHVVGTPAYMSPEQLSGETLDQRSDLYSAGLILWALIAGRPPFAELGSRGIWVRVQKPLPSLRERAGDDSISPALEDVLQSVLAAERELRPADARDFARRLREALDAPPTASPPDRPASQPQALAAAQPALRTATVPITAATIDPAPAEAPAEPLAKDPRIPFLVVARLPPSRLADAGERRYLAALAAPAGRGFSFGAQYWFALLTADSDGRAAGLAGNLVARLVDRYGDTARVAWGLTEPGFTLTAAELTGAVPLPGPLRDLLEKVT